MTTLGVNRLVTEHLAAEKSEWARRVESEFRVPVSGSLWPSIYWLACVVEVGDLGSTAEPSDDELRVVASYIDYKLTTFYRESYAAAVRALPLPLVPGHNTVVLVKHPDVPPEGTHWRGWGYRRDTWRTGSWPHSYTHRPGAPTDPLSLLEILDHVEGGGWRSTPNEAWESWKTERIGALA